MKYLKVPLDDVQTPKHGMIAIKDHWWIVEDDCVLGFKLYGLKSKDRPTPQCNTNKRIVEMALKSNLNQDVVFLPVAYWWPHECGCE